MSYEYDGIIKWAKAEGYDFDSLKDSKLIDDFIDEAVAAAKKKKPKQASERKFAGQIKGFKKALQSMDDTFLKEIKDKNNKYLREIRMAAKSAKTNRDIAVQLKKLDTEYEKGTVNLARSFLRRKSSTITKQEIRRERGLKLTGEDLQTLGIQRRRKPEKFLIKQYSLSLEESRQVLKRLK